ncbi:MAG: sensor histidine kinase, partial [Balneolaceae bacterium]
IANELHDGLGQYLSAVNMNFDSLFEDVSTLGKSEKEQFKHGLDLLKQAMQETRNISQNLMPKAIDDYGLVLAVESLVDDIEKNTGIQFYFYENLEEVDIPYNIQINLYRIVQEALNNAYRHSKCKKIHIQLVHSNNDIILTIEDDGCGFDPKKVSKKGLGLNSMQTRTAAISGKMEIDSKSGRGTLVSVIIPV